MTRGLVFADEEDVESSPVLSVLMPAFNEADSIEESIERVDDLVRPAVPSHEVVVVDDGSDDGTGEVVDRLSRERGDVELVRHDVDRGKGHALKSGAERVAGSYVLFLDADCDIHPGRLRRFVDEMERTGADVVVGSKRHPESDVTYPVTRRVLSRGYGALIELLFGLGVSDTQVGMKLLRREVVEDVVPLLLVKRYAFDVELLANAVRKGYDVAEAPVTIEYKGGSGVGAGAIARIAWDTAAVFYRMEVLRYYDGVDPDA